MSDLNEKPTIGASIIHTEPHPTSLLHPKPTHLLPNKPSFDSISPCSTNTVTEQCPSKTEDYDPTSNHPFSAFYSHPTTRTSFEQAKSESKINIAIYNHDLESGSRITHASQVEFGPEHHVHNDDKMWPCPKQIHQKELEMQKRKGCSPFRSLTKKQKFCVQALIALLAVGTITGLGVGISKAVGGGVFRTSNNSNAPISSR